jgi:DNA-binding protein Fis
MQRIVAFVAPLRAGGKSWQEGSGDAPTKANSPEHGEEIASSNPPTENCELKIEAILSDGQARRILESLLDREQYSECDSLIDDFLQISLELAGANACDLYEKIVTAVERRLISRVYDECDHVKTKAAARLGINRNTLNKRLKQHGLSTDELIPTNKLHRMNTRRPEPTHEED